MGRFQATVTAAHAVHVRPSLFNGADDGSSLTNQQCSFLHVRRSVDWISSRKSPEQSCLQKVDGAERADISAYCGDATSAEELKKCKPSAPSRGPRRSGKATPPEIPEQDLLAAVESLYYDQLKPYGRILRKRLSDRGVAANLASGETGLVHLRNACSRSDWIQIEPAQGGEWTALLVGCEPKFVDVYSPTDVYPQTLWRAAADYFEQVTGVEALLPGGRFSCAQCLVDRRLPFLHGYSLGSVCHIVQLAISQKKILGYSNDGITPYAQSQSMLKDNAAKQKSTFTNSQCDDGVGELPFATWDVVRSCVKDALAGDDNGPSPIPLSNIKRLFRTRYNTELSETALGHSKLSELLQDVRLSGICTVKLLDQGYFVIPQFTSAVEEETEAPSHDSASESSINTHEDSNTTFVLQWTVQNTFVHVATLHSDRLPRSKSTGELERSLEFLPPHVDDSSQHSRRVVHLSKFV